MSEAIYEYLRGQYPANTTRERLEYINKLWDELA
jgi:hypothetical protein